MLSPWYLVVRGNDADLRPVGELCASSAEHSLDQEQPGEWRLRSSTVKSTSGHEFAWTKLRELLGRLADVAAGAAETRVRLTPGSLGRTRADGGSNVFVFPETARLRAQAFPPTVVMGGTAPTEPPHVRLLRLDATNDHLRLALHFLNADLSWFNLWKAFEAIREPNHGAPSLVTKGWTRATEVGRFRETANSYSAVGDEARHALLGKPPPQNPMTLYEAEEFVRGLLSRWVASLS
jgi:hypothetical protein